MKAIKNIILIFFLSYSAIVVATEDNVYNSTNFYSTSAMQSCGSTLPIAAADGVTTADETIGTNTVTKPKRDGVNPDGGYGDPGTNTPLGDTPWVLMALLVAGYAVWVGKKYSCQIPDARK